VPIPRRFDRRPPERDTVRINDRIRVPKVRLIADDGQQIGIVERDRALEYARERDLDLVEIAPEADPPVCRVLDYSKYKYEQEQKRKAARKHQQQVTVREMKLRPKIATNDYETKKGHVLRFLKNQDKVKVTIMFRGREVAHPERGERLLRKLAGEVGELATIEQEPSQEGRNMTMLLAPVRAVPNSRSPEDEAKEAPEPAEASAVKEAPAVKESPAAAEAPAVKEAPEAATSQQQDPGNGSAPAADGQTSPVTEPARD
jgi:translation initiation factor IF-3